MSLTWIYLHTPTSGVANIFPRGDKGAKKFKGESTHRAKFLGVLKNLKKILHWKKFDKKSKYLNFHLGYNMSLPVVKRKFLMCLLYEQGV